MDRDEVALNCLLLDDQVPPAVAEAASYEAGDEPQPARLNSAGIIAALIVTVVLAFVLW